MKPIRRLPRRLARSGILCLISLLPVLSLAAAPAVKWVCSTDFQRWQQMPAPTPGLGNPDMPPQIRVDPVKTYQTMDGFGGCFNERGWTALAKASPAGRAQVLSALFGDDGCAFTLARVPIGASDFALDAYSLDDTPGDLALDHFSLDRDRRCLLPYIKAAMAVRPSLRCWGSPWSPPAWMKTNNNYSKGSLKSEQPILRSYAIYLARWVEAYRAAGVRVYALMPQNEPNVESDYPSCAWTGEQMHEFYANYLVPTLRNRKTDVELWLGTLAGAPANGGNNINYRALEVLEDPKVNAAVTGIAFQYDLANLTAEARELFPGKKLMQSETEAHDGKNTWDEAMSLFGHFKDYIGGGAGSYFAWNMVLDETGLSTWKWAQNALITVNSATGKVTYNGEYYVMRHFSQFVKPGAKRVLVTGPWSDRLAFVNPGGSAVVVVANTAVRPKEVVIAMADRSNGTFKATLPPRSVNTFVVPSKARCPDLTITRTTPEYLKNL